MFSFFKKKRHKPNARVKKGNVIFDAYVPENDAYALLESQREGYPLLMTVNTVIDDIYPKAIYGYMCEIVMELENVTEVKLPTDDELKEVAAFEDEIIANVIVNPDTPNVRIAGWISWNGQRELYLRVNDPEIVGDYLEKLSKSDDYARPFSFIVQEDKDWKETDWLQEEFRRAEKNKN